MSVKTHSRDYRANSVFGSLACDADADDRFWQEYEYGVPLDIPQAEEIEEEVVSSERRSAVQSVSPFALLGFAAAAVLIVFSLFARIQLSEVSAECVELQSEINELQQEQSKLLVAYESEYNLTQIEDYAIGTLGMQKPRSDQIIYINTRATDKAEVLSDGSSVGFADMIGDAISSLLSYFTKGGQ